MQTEILYEDKQILVAYKPAGLAVQTARIGEPDMTSELKNYVKGGYLGLVHRLDQPVEGLLVFGRTKAATAALSKQLAEGTLHKQYRAVLYGAPAQAAGELTDYLYKTRDYCAKIVSAEQAQETGAKRAVLRYCILKTTQVSENEQLSLAEISIETGRFHQIRAQMAHAGLPLLGDLKYGSERSVQCSREAGVRQVALCANALQFVHPAKGTTLPFTVTPRGGVFQKFGMPDEA
ncbi:MAG: RluA family pseudouridine synthase [Lachnospiraceae bacterium]|nr:RluA family pseudouridine synthase [Lachnospiraceae bacterium]